MNHDALFFGALLYNGGTPGDLGRIQRDHLDEQWRIVYDFCLAHLREQGKFPHPATVELQCQTVLAPAPEAIEFYAARIRDNAMRKVMEEGFIADVATPLNNAEGAKAIEGAKKVISAVQRDFPSTQRTSILYSSNIGTRWAAYQIRAAGGGHGLPLPWHTITAATRGLLPGEVWVMAARPNQGKTMTVVHVAVFLMKLGYRVLLASMETPAQSARPRNTKHRVISGACSRCGQRSASAFDDCPAALVEQQRLTVRMDAIASEVSAWRMLQGKLTPNELDRYQAYLAVQANPAAYGYAWGDIKVASPPDIRSITDLELSIADFSPDVVIWDSAYLAAGHEGRTRKDDYDALLIAFKQVMEAHGIPGILTWHFSREVDEKAKGASMNDTAYTDELCRLTDVIIGCFRPPELQNAKEAILRSLKVRDGISVPELRIAWDVADRIDFREIAATLEGQPEGEGRRRS